MAYERPFRATLFYGNPKVHLRKENWNLLRNLKDDRGIPWIVFGDFTEVLYAREMEGMRECSNTQMSQFREALQECDLRDMGCRGNQFSFSNRRSGERETRVRLDRAVVNSEWCDQFPNSLSTLGFSSTSDHKPLVIQMEKEMHRGGTKRNYKFEPMWLRVIELKDAVTNSWGKLWCCPFSV